MLNNKIDDVICNKVRYFFLIVYFFIGYFEVI